MRTVKQAARQLGVSVSCVYALVAQGRIGHYRIGQGRGTIRISDIQIESYLEQSRVEVEKVTSSTSGSDQQNRQSNVHFEHLNAARMREAWKRQGDRGDRKREGNARSSE